MCVCVSRYVCIYSCASDFYMPAYTYVYVSASGYERIIYLFIQ